MNLRQLRYFVAVAEHGSISLAAASVRIAQSAISSQIAALEQELGTPLLLRHARGVALTEPGRVLLDHAGRIERAFRLAEREVQAAGAGRQEIAIGIPVSMSATLTMPLMRAIEGAFPGAQVRIYEGLTGDLRGWLRSGKVETAILYGRDDADGIDLVPLVDDELVLFGSDPGLPADGRPVSFEELVAVPLFATDEDHPVRPMLARLAQSRGLDVSFAGRINSVHQLKALAGSGRGCTILPKVALVNELAAAPDLVHAIHPPIHMRSYIASMAKESRLVETIKAVAGALIRADIWPGAAEVSV